MSLGLKQAGFDVRFAFDRDEQAIKTYQENIGSYARVADARSVSGADLLKAASLQELDLFSGGPPCQGFSKQRRGAHLAKDERNDLVREYARLVKEIGPKAFIFENVQVFGQKRGRDLIEYVQGELTNYNFTEHFVCSSDFGLAQRRSRFLMIGLRKDLDAPAPILRGNGPHQTVWDAIGHLPPPPDDCSEHPDFPNHMKCRITPLNEQRFRHVPQGGGWADIPQHLRLPCHQEVDASKGGWPDVYGRLQWGGQCPTITAGFDSFTRGRYGHPEQHRALTLHEGALIQGFPDRFRFYGNRGDVRLQIGNAVPPPLAKAVGLAIRQALAAADVQAAQRQRPLVAAE